jgi:putative cardiolipin synthase
MALVLIGCAVVLLLGLAALLGVSFYGRLARPRHRRRSTALPLAPADTAIDRLVGLLAADALGASGLAMLEDNDDAFASRAIAARSAGRSLDLMYYIWHRDLTGRLLAHEVIEAADRGVRVRILFDDINAHGADRIYLGLDSHPNIQVRLFNPSRARQGGLRRGLEMVFRAFSATRRMHNKAWIADGRLAIVGGRNIGDEYFNAAEAANFHDLDLLLLGPAVQQASDIFDSFWNSASAIPIKALAPRRRRSLRRLRRRLAKLVASDPAAPFLDRIARRASVDSLLGGAIVLHWTRQVRVVSDPPEKVRGQRSAEWLMVTLYPIVTGAAQRLEITSPYFVPGDEGTAALVDLVKKGVSVVVLTNSLAATDVAIVHGGYAPSRVPLLKGKVQLFELQVQARSGNLSLLGSGGASLHTKAFTVDGLKGFIGSFNFDPRSASLNTEMGVLFEHPVLAREMANLFRREILPAASYRLSLGDDGRLRWEGEVDGIGLTLDREPDAGIVRRAVARLVGFLPIHSQL